MFFNRDLSWLGFNLRVLEQAADHTVPLFERLKFLSIFSSNLDEFFRVRYPSIIALSKLNRKTRMQVSIGSSEDIPEKIQNEINRQLNIFGSVLIGDIIPNLRQQGIFFYYNEPIHSEHLQEVREIFLSQVLSFIQPIYVDNIAAQNFLPENNLLYLVVTLKEPQQGTVKQAILNIPSTKLKRFFVLSPLNEREYVIFIDDIVRENIAYIFPGMEIVGAYSIKFNRDAELYLSDEYSTNVLNKIEKQLRKRDFGAPSRFLFENSMPRNLQLFLAAAFDVKYEDMFAGGRYHHLSDLSSFPRFNELQQYEKLKPISRLDITESGDIFNVLNTEDVLLHVPYQSYNPVLHFFNQAAIDSNVTDIYVTLYRVAAESHIVNALISAARNGKKVSAFIELKARFDEANNIKWSRVMKDAGITIYYSDPAIKVHSKIGLVRRKKGENLSSYAILSTGNFNEITAQFYTDHVLMTSDTPIIKELNQLFKFLQRSYKDPTEEKLKFNRLLVSRFNLTERFEKMVEKEIEHAQKGEPALIRIKVNNLEEPHFITLLCKASQAGVEVRLIVRSVCCLIPGLLGLSENISVKRIVDRYLEHSRLLIFGAGDNSEVFMGSADLMTRNIHNRIEVFVTVSGMEYKKQLIDYFDIQWQDNDPQKAIYSYLQNKQ